MTEYKPLLTEPCAVLRWLASECVLNKTASTCGIDALLRAIPSDLIGDLFVESNREQIDLFRAMYDNPEMRAVITGETPDGEPVQNPGWWPTYEQERKAGNISGDAEPWN